MCVSLAYVRFRPFLARLRLGGLVLFLLDAFSVVLSLLFLVFHLLSEVKDA